MKKLKPLAFAFCLVSVLLLSVMCAGAKTVSVCDYGADGMSEADQKEFFAAALAAAEPGDTVFVPNGTYPLSSILLPTGVTLKGESREGTVLRAITSGAAVVSLRLGSGITLSDLTVDGNMMAKYCVYLKSGDDNTVENVKMCNLLHDGSSVIGLYINGRCRRTVVRGCLFENIGVRESGDENEDKGTGICIYGNSMFSFPHDDAVLIENNVFNKMGRTGIAADYVSDVRIVGNTIKNTGYVIGKGLSVEIYGASCKGCVIEGNTVDHWMSIHGSGHAVRRNKIGTDFIEGESYYKRYAIENIATDTVYSENEISAGNKYGILDLVSGGNVLYSGVSVKRCTQAAYSVSACNDFGDKNRRYFYDCDFSDTIKSESLSIYPSSSGIGVEINNKVSSFVFEDVRITGNGRYGMQSKGVSGCIELRSCLIADNAGTGLLFGLTNPFELNDVSILRNGKLNADGTYAGNVFSEPTPFSSAAPAADFEPDKTVYTVGDTAVFTNTSQTFGDEVVLEQYLWDFDTGLPGVGRDASFTFTEPGEYTVSLVVWDSAGRGDLKRMTVTVNEPAAPTEPSTAPTETDAQDKPEERPNAGFAERLKSFFASIIEWLRSLFGL